MDCWAGEVGEYPTTEVAATRLVRAVGSSLAVVRNGKRLVEIVGKDQLQALRREWISLGYALIPDHAAIVVELKLANVLLRMVRVIRQDANGNGAVWILVGRKKHRSAGLCIEGNFDPTSVSRPNGLASPPVGCCQQRMRAVVMPGA